MILEKEVMEETNKEHNKYNNLITRTILIVSPFLNLSLDCKCILKLKRTSYIGSAMYEMRLKKYVLYKYLHYRVVWAIVNKSI